MWYLNGTPLIKRPRGLIKSRFDINADYDGS